jgi:hypothetical protein
LIALAGWLFVLGTAGLYVLLLSLGVVVSGILAFGLREVVVRRQ